MPVKAGRNMSGLWDLSHFHFVNKDGEFVGKWVRRMAVRGGYRPFLIRRFDIFGRNFVFTREIKRKSGNLEN